VEELWLVHERSGSVMAGVGFAFDKPRAFVLAWPGDEEFVAVQWDGLVTFIPGRANVAVKNTGRWRWDAAKTPSGQPIPGTVVITDMHSVNAAGATTKTFDAHDYCKGLASQHKWMERGLIILDDVSKLPEVFDVALSMWQAAQDVNDESIIREEIERIAQWEKRGQPAPPADQARARLLQTAIQRKAARTKAGDIIMFTKEELLSALEGTTVVNPQAIAASQAAGSAAVATGDPVAISQAGVIMAPESELAPPDVPDEQAPPQEVVAAKSEAKRLAIQRAVRAQRG